MSKYHQIKNISFKNDKIFIIIDGKKYSFRLSNISKKLSTASDYEREKYEISPSGYGIHWDLIDEDLSIDGLLSIKHKPSFKKHLTAEIELNKSNSNFKA